MKLVNPFIEKAVFWTNFNNLHMVKNWIFLHRNKIWSEVSRGEETTAIDQYMDLPYIDWSETSLGYSSFGLDYRESSLFVPINVINHYLT